MKTYNLEEIQEFAKKSSKYIAKEEDTNSYSMEEFDKAKTRVLKYVLYKKRTESEIRKKFDREYSEEILDSIIEDLRENDYINDKNYIIRTVDEFIALRNLSIREIRYKLLAKGIKTTDIDDYISNNEEKINEYEIKSAKNIANKKRNQMEDKDIKNYLIKKGYREESIKEAL